MIGRQKNSHSNCYLYIYMMVFGLPGRNEKVNVASGMLIYAHLKFETLK